MWQKNSLLSHEADPDAQGTTRIKTRPCTRTWVWGNGKYNFTKRP